MFLHLENAIEDALVNDEAREKLLSELGLVTEKE